MLSKIVVGVLSMMLLAGSLLLAGFSLQSSKVGDKIPIVSSVKEVTDKVDLGIPKVLDPENVPDKMNVLLIGVGGEGHDGENLTDTIIMAEIDNLEKKINLISIPRDFLVFDEKGYFYKINAIYSFGLDKAGQEEEAILALGKYIENITGLGVDHYVKVDFEGFVRLVDTLGGVEVDVKERIYDERYPGPNFSYETFEVEEGYQTMDGETALKYARSRYSSEKGDLDRAARQQQIIESVSIKASKLNPVWNLNKILSLVGIFKDNVSTDFSLNSLRDLYITYQGLDAFDMNHLVLDFDLEKGLLSEQQRYFGRTRGYVLVPRAGDENYFEIREKVDHIDDLDRFEKQLEAIREEKSSLDIYSQLSSEKTSDLVKFLELKGIDVEVKYLSGMDFSSTNSKTNSIFRVNELLTDNSSFVTWDYLQNLFDAQTLLESDFVPPTQQLTVMEGLVPEKQHLNTKSNYILYLYNDPGL
jgi:LCP family protein required for cell wall assembly